MGGRSKARELRRQRILESASHEFAEHDYAAVSMGAVARRAAVSRGTVYNYFGSKERLYRKVLAQRFGQLLAGRVRSVLVDGIGSGAFRELDPDAMSQAILDAVEDAARALSGARTDDPGVARAVEELRCFVRRSLLEGAARRAG